MFYTLKLILKASRIKKKISILKNCRSCVNVIIYSICPGLWFKYKEFFYFVSDKTIRTAKFYSDLTCKSDDPIQMTPLSVNIARQRLLKDKDMARNWVTSVETSGVCGTHLREINQTSVSQIKNYCVFKYFATFKAI